MLSDEEKAIEELKNKKADYFMISNLMSKTLLNLIEKQSKEIEEYKKQLDLDNECEIALNSKVMDLEKEIEELKEGFKIQEHNYQVAMGEIKQRCVDKIKAKIEEVQKRLKEETRTDFLIILKILENELQSLLEKE